MFDHVNNLQRKEIMFREYLMTSFSCVIRTSSFFYFCIGIFRKFDLRRSDDKENDLLLLPSLLPCCLRLWLSLRQTKNAADFADRTNNTFVIQYSFRVSSMTQELCNGFIGPYPVFFSVFERVDKTLISYYIPLSLYQPDARLRFIFEWWPKVLP